MQTIIIYYCIFGIIYGIHKLTLLEENKYFDEELNEISKDKPLLFGVIITMSIFWVVCVGLSLYKDMEANTRNG